MIIAVVITAIVFGGGVYLWQNTTITEQQDELDAKSETITNKDLQISEKEKIITNRDLQISDLEDEKIEIEKLACKGLWVDNECQLNACVDSDADEQQDGIYVKGSVTTTDGNGVSTTVSDDCSGSGTQVNERWCYESPAGSGNMVGGQKVHNCPNGCEEGACIL